MEERDGLARAVARACGGHPLAAPARLEADPRRRDAAARSTQFHHALPLHTKLRLLGQMIARMISSQVNAMIETHSM